VNFTAAYNEAVIIITVCAVLLFKFENFTIVFSPGNQTFASWKTMIFGHAQRKHWSINYLCFRRSQLVTSWKLIQAASHCKSFSVMARCWFRLYWTPCL